MEIKNLTDTKIPEYYSTTLYNEGGYDVAQEHTWKVLDTAVNGVTACLKDIESKDTPVVFKFSKLNGEFILAAIVRFFENEDDKTQPGNWNYSWTFDEKDIPENAKVVTAYDNQVSSYFTSAGLNKFGMGFRSVDMMGDVFNTLFSVIRQYLNDNVKDGEECGVKLDGVIEFRAAVEDGVIVMSAEPDGEIKKIIKDDAKIEK